MEKTMKLTAIGILVMIPVIGLMVWDEPRYRIELALERGEIEETAREYFKAGMEHDYRTIYSFLAPSSTYRRTHTYDQFLEDVTVSPVGIKTYRIVDIYRLRGNHDPATYPEVKRFVQVEVDVDVGFADTGTTSTCNYCFTFIKERGRWFKG